MYIGTYNQKVIHIFKAYFVFPAIRMIFYCIFTMRALLRRRTHTLFFVCALHTWKAGRWAGSWQSKF